MVRNTIFIVSILFWLFFTRSSVCISDSNDDISVIRERVLELTIWPPISNISDTVANALNYNNTLNSSCYWPDIDYYDKAIIVWLTSFHMRRITTMLQALTVNGSSIQNDPTVMTNVHCALNVWLINDWKNPNWWYNQIYIPLQATSQLLMLGENATSVEIRNITEISYRASWWMGGDYNVGTNLIWMIQSEIYRSLATKNVTGIEQAFSRMWQDVVISNVSREGIQVDFAYHFHSKLFYSGAYGRDWVNNILLFIQCSFNTKYQPDDNVLVLLAEFLVHGDAWVIVNNEWDWHVLGRFIAAPGNGFAHGLMTDWIRTVAGLLQSNETRNQLINFADRLDNKPNTPVPIGNKHFFVSDYLVHRRANWMASIKTQSYATSPTECLLNENLKAEHVGQGVLNLYRMGFNDYAEIFPILDWQAINGITVEHDIDLENCTDGRFDWIRMGFIGGVSDGEYGLVAMDTATHHLTAQRSWHFYDDGIIALATNLTLSTTTTAWTTLASRLLRQGQLTIGFINSTIITLNDGNYSFPYTQGQTSNVQWIHIGDSNIAYLLPLEQQYHSIGVQLGIKTGSYNELSPFKGNITARMITVYIDHGRGPYVLDYNYMILPNVSVDLIPSLIKKYNEEQVFGCISTDNRFHGTMWPSLKRAAFVLWQNHTTTFSCQSPTFQLNITIPFAGNYLFSETNENFTLTASSPKFYIGQLEVRVNRLGYGLGCTISTDLHGTTTNMTLPLPILKTLQGSSVNLTCNKSQD